MTEFADILKKILIALIVVIIILAVVIWIEAAPQTKKLPEGQTCSNTFDTDKEHQCSCMAGMKCPMEKPKPCDDPEEGCAPPEYGPDSTKCISPFCKKDSCRCANACKS